ncbi:septum formation inhibitor Maf [Pontimicrobium sp. SW4]|uniref:Septum formation inhibitor Maf n=1 Tax=Pontimicrobium sp. SW4 TaxID=3153519 RepID=A0AAU7BW16_9FLAO
MKTHNNKSITSFLIAVLLIVSISCKNNEDKKTTKLSSNTKYRELSDEFKDYWYAGEAEITSYELEQARYGEIRKGHAVLIYVTEDFLPVEQVKANNQNPENISVLKLNATKKFNTGIYPYSIMQSTFYPLPKVEHAIKISSSIQEWCGQTYMQLNNKKDFEINSHSYFEGEADQNYQLEKTILENELWTQLRINPKELPTGSLNIIPSFEFISLKHVELKPYQANAELKLGSYSISYPELERVLTINFNKTSPYEILSWTETTKSDSETLTTKATKLKTIKSPYWSKNSNKDSMLRETLMLK